MRALALASLLLAACTVDLGAPPDAAPCAPSTEFFAQQMWLPYFDANECASSACHGAKAGHGYLRFQPPGGIPAPNTRLADWPPSWRANYYSSIQLLSCDDFPSSRLLTVPENLADPHPPGDSVQSHATAEALFRDWATAP